MAESAFGELWAYSAVMLLVMSCAAFMFGITLTHGAGFYCRLAFLRYLQRLAFMILALALLYDAMSVIDAHQPSSMHALVTEIAFMLVMAASALRHMSAPEIPHDASWRNPIVKTKLMTRRDVG